MKTPAYRRLAAVIILFAFATVGAAQRMERLVDWQLVIPSPKAADIPALKIVGMRVNETQISAGKPFMADEDWLDKLTFRIKNVSDKTINIFWFHVAFPEIDLGGGGHAGLGILYKADKSPDGRKPIAPGNEVEVTFAADKLQILRQTSTRMIGTTHLTRLNILPGAAFFDDGSDLGGISLRSP